MDIYLVGGAVRDKLLGLKVKDRDWVVVGATPEQMIAKGFRPVGRDFPVFLHPETQEEYALARTERKSGHGYTGFVFHTSPDVTLEEDLIRRDLTINAMAEDSHGHIIDPYNGQQDLANGILRHVSPAFEEDPLRVLRVARFAARLSHKDFTIAPDTQALMKHIAQGDELNYLPPERIWQETEKALTEHSPDVYFTTLAQCGALNTLMPQWHTLLSQNPTGLQALAKATDAGESTLVRFGCLFPPSASVELEQIKSFLKHMRFPSAYTERGGLVNEYYSQLIAAQQTVEAHALVTLFEQTDAFRRPERFLDALISSYYLAKASGIALQKNRRQVIEELLQKCRIIDARPIVAKGYKGKEIGEQLRIERIERVSGALK